MFGFGKTKQENEKLKRENNVLKKAYSKSKNENEKLRKMNDRLAADGLRHGSSEAGKYLVGNAKNNLFTKRKKVIWKPTTKP